jgi:AhpD family alkylhydroperoxidase
MMVLSATKPKPRDSSQGQWWSMRASRSEARASCALFNIMTTLRFPAEDEALRAGPPKVRELIALAVAVTLRCDGCVTVHTEAAIEHGATKEEIAEAQESPRPSTAGRRLFTQHA